MGNQRFTSQFKFRACAVVMPVLLFLTVTAFPVVRAIRAARQSGVYAEEISPGGDETVSASSGVICWGLKRGTNGSIPEVPSSYKLLLRRYNALYVADTTQRRIYLTFDEGYENGYTAQILDTLHACGVKAIFFITGDYFTANPELIRRMVEEGHEVGNHTVHHYSLPTVSVQTMESEILDLDRQFLDKFGRQMRFLRPPKGEFNENTLKVAQNIGYQCIFWSFAYEDWIPTKQRGPEYALKMVTDNVHPGEIMLLHAVSSDNAGALADIIAACREAGYAFGDPAELAV